MRQCAGCRQRHPRAQLVRFVRGTDGLPVADPDRSAPGRGLSLCPRVGCATEAVKRRAFARAFGPEAARTDLPRVLGALANAVQLLVTASLRGALRAGVLVPADAARGLTVHWVEPTVPAEYPLPADRPAAREIVWDLRLLGAHNGVWPGRRGVVTEPVWQDRVEYWHRRFCEVGPSARRAEPGAALAHRSPAAREADRPDDTPDPRRTVRTS